MHHTFFSQSWDAINPQCCAWHDCGLRADLAHEADPLNPQ